MIASYPVVSCQIDGFGYFPVRMTVYAWDFKREVCKVILT